MTTEQQICTRIINENIRNVISDEPLTLSLKQLNTDCRFKKFYNDYCDNIYGSRVNEYQKEYREKNKDKKMNIKKNIVRRIKIRLMNMQKNIVKRIEIR